MTPGEIGEALVHLVPGDLLADFVRAAQGNVAQRRRDGLRHSTEVAALVYYLASADATRRERPEPCPEIERFDTLVHRWPTTASVAEVLGISPRQVSRLLTGASRRMRDPEDRRRRFDVWDPAAVEAERLRRRANRT